MLLFHDWGFQISNFKTTLIIAHNFYGPLFDTFTGVLMLATI